MRNVGHHDAERAKNSAAVSNHHRVLLRSLHCSLLVSRFGVPRQACHTDEGSCGIRCRSRERHSHDFLFGYSLAFAPSSCHCWLRRLSALDRLDIFTKTLSYGDTLAQPSRCSRRRAAVWFSYWASSARRERARALALAKSMSSTQQGSLLWWVIPGVLAGMPMPHIHLDRRMA